MDDRMLIFYILDILIPLIFLIWFFLGKKTVRLDFDLHSQINLLFNRIKLS